MDNTVIQCPGCHNPLTCAYCGRIFRPADVSIMTEAERLVLETLRDIRNSPMSPVPTRLIADFTGYSSRWARSHLTNLMRRGVVCTPAGKHSGWVEVYAAEFSMHMGKQHASVLMAAA